MRNNEPNNNRERRHSSLSFIHSSLDDYGLTPVEFRVYARIARRAGASGKHSESIPNMARDLMVCDRTVQYALRLLTTSGLISRHSRGGRTNEYSLNSLSSWRDKKDLKNLRQQNFRSSGATTDRGATRNQGVVQPRGQEVQLGQELEVQPATDEGTPFEGTPFEGTPFEGTPFEGTPFEGTPPEGTPNEPHQSTERADGSEKSDTDRPAKNYEQRRNDAKIQSGNRRRRTGGGENGFMGSITG